MTSSVNFIISVHTEKIGNLRTSLVTPLLCCFRSFWGVSQSTQIELHLSVALSAAYAKIYSISMNVAYSNNNIILALVLSDSKRKKSLALQDFCNWKSRCILAEANGYIFIFFCGVAFPEHQERNSY